MRVLNKSTMMIVALLVLVACQADEKPAKQQTPMPQTAVSQVAQPASPVVQAETTKSEATTSPTSKKEAVPTNDSKFKDAAQARMQQAQAAAIARQNMGMQLAAAMKKAAAKPEVKPAAATVEKAAVSQQTPAKNMAAKSPIPAGDAHQGKKLARKCVACHDFGSRNKMGPALGGVFNRQAGTPPGYKYGYTAFITEGKAWHWDAAHLAAWLCDSKAAVRAFTGNSAAKTKMPRQRICDAAKQADIIAYLKTL